MVDLVLEDHGREAVDLLRDALQGLRVGPGDDHPLAARDDPAPAGDGEAALATADRVSQVLVYPDVGVYDERLAGQVGPLDGDHAAPQAHLRRGDPHAALLGRADRGEHLAGEHLEEVAAELLVGEVPAMGAQQEAVLEVADHAHVHHAVGHRDDRALPHLERSLQLAGTAARCQHPGHQDRSGDKQS